MAQGEARSRRVLPRLAPAQPIATARTPERKTIEAFDMVSLCSLSDGWTDKSDRANLSGDTYERIRFRLVNHQSSATGIAGRDSHCWNTSRRANGGYARSSARSGSIR